MVTFEAAKQQKANLQAQVDFFSQALQEFSKDSSGLVPYDVRHSPEYLIAKYAYDVHFAELQKFNRVYVKQYKREITAERAAKYIELAKQG